MVLGGGGTQWDTWRISKMLPLKVGFREAAGRRISGSLNREGQTRTETELCLQSRMGPPWGEWRPSSVLPGKGRFLLASEDWGHHKQSGQGRCPPTCQV